MLLLSDFFLKQRNTLWEQQHSGLIYSVSPAALLPPTIFNNKIDSQALLGARYLCIFLAVCFSQSCSESGERGWRCKDSSPLLWRGGRTSLQLSHTQCIVRVTRNRLFLFLRTTRTKTALLTSIQ